MIRVTPSSWLSLWWLLALCAGVAACGDERDEDGEVLVAVAANFAETAAALEVAFETEAGFDITMTTGSTGALYAQIRHGAPYDVLLAADQDRPAMLEADGAAVEGTRFTYATGKLVLWSAGDGVRDGASMLEAGAYEQLAIANPDLAPYGAAAIETLGALGVLEAAAPKLVRGENVGQAMTMVATGNAALGFVALAQVVSPDNPAGGSYWEVPQGLYTPIRQDAVLLKRAAGNRGAEAFMSWLASEPAQTLIRAHGYEAG